jgi:cobaltochelatase CobT
VVQRHEQAGAIEVFGLGVGLDLSAFYARSHVLDLGAAIGRAMFGEVIELLAGRHRR